MLWLALDTESGLRRRGPRSALKRWMPPRGSSSQSPDRRSPLPKIRPKGIVPPKPVTLKRYGLSEAEWFDILKGQGWVCVICEKTPESRKWNIDHDHVKGWKKLPDDERKKHVRGILCFWCNHNYVGRRLTVEKAQNVADYLRRHREKMGS